MIAGYIIPASPGYFSTRLFPILFLLFLLFPFDLSAQRGSISINPKKLSKTEQQMVEDAHNLYEEGNYQLAIPYYQKLLEAHPKELFFKYKLAACYLHKSDEHEKALEYFELILREKPKSPDINYFLGRAYHLNYKFDEAIAQFETYIGTNPPADRKKDTQRLIKNCENGKKLVAAPVEAKIENLGVPVNTDASEYVPVISSDQSVMIFTYRGEQSTGELQGDQGYFEDVFYTEKAEDKWIKPRSIGENINSYSHDASIALSPDGQILFIYKTTNKGDIYVSKLEGTNWSAPVPLKGDVNSNAWEGSISLSADGRTVYFSSERPGGSGGKDIYKAELLSNGNWGRVRNMGPFINTKYDDDAPFIHPDGKTLYFSSKGHNSMGGYDVFRTELSGESWSAPVNAGYPVNTPDDDIYFVLAANGTTGYYSSGKAGGASQQDIYTIEIPSSNKALLLVKGFITLDDKPVEAMVKVMVEKVDTAYSENNSNAATGKYLLTLPGGKNYRLTYTLEGYEPQTQDINADALTGYLEKEVDIRFYSSGFARTSLKANDTVKATTSAVATELPDISNLKAEGLVYKVQVAAYRLPDNYKFKHLATIGKVERLDFEDGITRFTMGSFNTLAEADVLKKKCIDAGVSDAFVTVIYKGKRMTLEDLAKSNIFQK